MVKARGKPFLSLCLSLSLSLSLSVVVCRCLFVCPCVRVSVSRSVFLVLCLSFRLSRHSPLSVSIRLTIWVERSATILVLELGVQPVGQHVRKGVSAGPCGLGRLTHHSYSYTEVVWSVRLALGRWPSVDARQAAHPLEVAFLHNIPHT